jgi:hypothetical protein
MLRAKPTIMRGVRGLAIFSSAATDVLEVVRLPSSGEPMAVVERVAMAGEIVKAERGYTLPQ